MRKVIIAGLIGFTMILVTLSACLKEKDAPLAPYDLNVILHSTSFSKGMEDRAAGFIKFRQDPDPAKIISLDTWVKGLAPNHEYQLQRAVDAINVVDGECTSTTWLTLGLGLTPQSILTKNEGNGHEALWRDISSVPTGSKFDIHFQIIDKATSEVVLTSDCLNYEVR